MARLAATIFRRDTVVLVILVSATMLLIWNGTAFFTTLSIAEGEFSPALKLASTTLTLNVALILFGWRRYVDLLHEAERRTEQEQRALHLASTDHYSGLLNSKGFADAGQALLERLDRDRGERLAITAFNLNRLRAVGDRHGYEYGDRVIRRFAELFAAAAPEGALLARVASEELVAAFVVSGEKWVADVATAADTLLQALAAPLDEDGRVVQLGISAGIATSTDKEDHVGVSALLRRADIAMNQAATARSARALWFDAAMERALVIQGEIEQGIRTAIENDQFLPFFEPQVDLRTGRLVGFEVLARWDHPLTGTISPDRFIPVAEEIGLIGRLSEQVVVKALAAAADWPSHIGLSINIAPSQLGDSWLASKVAGWLDQSGFPARRLTVEITESSLFADLEMARTIVAAFQRQGIALALDDFGSGFSSLANLKSLPFDRIKVDHDFVSSLTRDVQNAAIVRAVTTMAQALDVPVTAEGIEDAATLNAVLAMGCSVGQGWYLGKPMSAADAAAMIVERDAPGLAAAR